MREVNLAGLDLNLLPPLEALLRRRSVTRAGEDVGLSQPAMSRALARLRILLDDPLLVRGGGGLVLTPTARTLSAPLSEVLMKVRGLLRRPDFDPASVQRTVRIAATDFHAVMFCPPCWTFWPARRVTLVTAGRCFS